MEKPPSDDSGQATPRRRRRSTKLKVVEQPLPGGRVRWIISGLYVDGKRKREVFTTKDAADRRLQMLKIARDNIGTQAERYARNVNEAVDSARAADLVKPFGVSIHDAAREYAACRDALDGTGLSLPEVVKEAVERHEARQRSLSLHALGESFQADPETAKKAATYRKDCRRRWARFCKDFGEETLAIDVTPAQIRRWLSGLPVGDLSKGNYHRNLGAVFAYGLNSELIEENPFRKVKKPRVERKDGVAIFTPAQMRALLDAADPQWLPLLTIGAFAGLRPFEIQRLAWEEIDLKEKEKFIEVKASKSKTRQRRLVKISPNLAAWLRPYAGETGPIRPDGMPERRLRNEAMEKAKVKEWPVDVLRHSFASYHLAFHKDINATALELDHQSTKMLFKHYREAVTPKAAREWWALRPPPRKGGKSPPAKRKK